MTHAFGREEAGAASVSFELPAPDANHTSEARQRARRLVGRAARAGARRLGQDLLKREYYTPVPHPEQLSEAVYARRSPTVDAAFDAAGQLRLLDELGPYLREVQPPRGFFDNIMYKPFEAELLYAMVRHLRPERIIELGSGFTSLVIAAAVRANAQEGSRSRYLAYDPYPRPFVAAGLDGLDELRSIDAHTAPIEDFESLSDRDILFVDSTHTVKIGSEVNRIVLDVLPRLAAGVVVHFHDIFLPFEYPRAYVESGLYFAEQYLLEAFLALNTDFEIVCGTHALWHEHREDVRRRLPTIPDGADPTAFWLRRR